MENNFLFGKPLTVKEWLNSEEVKKLQSISPREFVEVWFNRMPIRPTYQKSDLIYTPVDGILTHIGLFDKDKDIFNIKGIEYNLEDIVGFELTEKKYYVAGIFLTAFSVHLARFPISGIIKEIIDLPPILTGNQSMIPAEYNLINKKKIVSEDYKFVYYNQRKVYVLYEPVNKMYVYYVSISDREVNSLLDFCSEKEIVRQGQRMQFITWGSYALLIIPKKKHYKLTPLVEPFHYLYSPIHPIFKVSH